ncbi:hypothetical protein [Bradyrhizobium sp.]|jgi:hypothetical protein|uniref:hypothetical protein n=1 Tax=Bradyrhizobium sp. TaxID=376 RepID=UPI003C796891
MRVAMIVVSILVVATPSEASKSCMSKTEARQHFGSVHIYWHGPDHCWDATSTRGHHQIAHRVQRKIDQPKWRDAMSAMSPNQTQTMLPNEPVQAPPVDLRAEVGPSLIDARWVDFAQVPQSIIERKPEPAVMPRGVLLVLAFIAFAVTVAIIDVLFRNYNQRTRSAG